MRRLEGREKNIEGIGKRETGTGQFGQGMEGQVKSLQSSPVCYGYLQTEMKCQVPCWLQPSEKLTARVRVHSS